jgi:hypothetical protein
MTTSTTGPIVSRRSALAGLGAGSLGLALAATARQATAQEATPYPTAGHPMVGTWIVDRNPDAAADPPTVVVFTADGVWIDPLVGAAGAWQATGPRSAAWTLVGYDQGSGGYFVVRTAAEVDDAGTSYAGLNTVTIVAPDGTVLAAMQGTPHGIRLQIEPVEAGGTPLAGFPTWTSAPAADATPTA